MPADPIAHPQRAVPFLLSLVGRGRMAMLFALMLLSSATEGLGLLMLVPVTQLVSGAALPGLDHPWLHAVSRLPLAALLGGFVALVALRSLIVYQVQDIRSAIGLSLTQRLRTLIQEAVVGADWRWLSAQRSADHATLIVTEAGRIANLTDTAINCVVAAVTLAVLSASALLLSWRLALLGFGIGTVLAAVMLVVRKRRNDEGMAFGAAYRDLEEHVINGLAHLRAARLAGAQGALLHDFSDTAETLRRLEQRFQRMAIGARLTVQILAAIGLAVLTWLALRVLDVSIVLLVPMLAIFARIAPLFEVFHTAIIGWRFNRPALSRLLDVVDQAEKSAEPVIASPAPVPFRHSLELRDVTFRHAGRSGPVFDNFRCVIRAGGIVGFTGPSGSGKSTLADLVSGLVAPDGGEILVDGVVLDPVSRLNWRRQVAYVEQTPYLFHGTIERNLVWGMDAVAPRAIEEALASASAHFVFDLPEGVRTIVGERGHHLSGGERQRITLARALLRKPSLLILDEVTAALDHDNEAAIGRAVAALRGKCTVLVLGHRPALLELADEVVDLSRHGHDRPA